MSRSRSRKRCGRGCGVCAALLSDLPIIRERIADRDLKPESVQAAYDDCETTCDLNCDVCWGMGDDDDSAVDPPQPLRVPLIEIARVA